MENSNMAVATINNQDIQLVTDVNGDVFVPIKPICQALGIAEDSQRRKILEHPVLASTTTLSVVVAADNKTREMFCLPYKYIFGWLFTINPKNVAPEAKEAVLKYSMECYEALYNHFALSAKFSEYKTTKLNEIRAQKTDVLIQKAKVQSTLKELETQEREIINLEKDEWIAEGRQARLFL